MSTPTPPADGAGADGRLFDPDPYNVPGKIPKPPRQRKTKSVDTIPVRTSTTWRMVSRKTRGVLHAKAPGTGSSQTACGIAAQSMTFDDGELFEGCPRCFARVEPSASDSQDETAAT